MPFMKMQMQFSMMQMSLAGMWMQNLFMITQMRLCWCAMVQMSPWRYAMMPVSPWGYAMMQVSSWGYAMIQVFLWGYAMMRMPLWRYDANAFTQHRCKNQEFLLFPNRGFLGAWSQNIFQNLTYSFQMAFFVYSGGLDCPMHHSCSKKSFISI